MFLIIIKLSLQIWIKGKTDIGLLEVIREHPKGKEIRRTVIMVKKNIHNFGKRVRNIPTIKKDMIQQVQQNNIRLTVMRMTGNTSLVHIHQNLRQKDICLTAMRMTGNTSLVDVNHLELSDNPIHLTAMRIAGTKSLTK
ncbi:MAG: hypothetical protein MJE68_06680 [Proteobacteria bacterium]|nr:hypothetical protein [Pseudomonadota bacterium]